MIESAALSFYEAADMPPSPPRAAKRGSAHAGGAPGEKARVARSIDLAEEIGQLLARSRRLVFAAAARRLDESGESIHAWRVLAHLAREGATAQCDLAMALAQHPAWVSRLVDELEAEGVVRRRRDAHDRRKLRVEVTVAGRARYEARRAEVNEAVEQVLQPLDRDEREQLRALLLKLGP